MDGQDLPTCVIQVWEALPQQKFTLQNDKL